MCPLITCRLADAITIRYPFVIGSNNGREFLLGRNNLKSFPTPTSTDSEVLPET